MKKSLETMQSIVDSTAAELIDIHNVKKFPRKTRTHNSAPKKSTVHKAKRHPAMAKPAVANDTTNTAWEADKAARKAARKAKPVFVKPIVPNKGMGDATQEYLIEICWEQIVEGNENAYAALDALIPHDTKTPETATPADVDTDMFLTEKVKIRKIEKEIAELPYKWARLEERINKLNDAAKEAKKKASTTKRLATLAKKSYIAADKETQKKTYSKMMERIRNAKVALAQVEKRNNELLKALKDQDDFADAWLPTEERLNELLAKANERFEIAKLARQHERRLEALEDAFTQRYERADWVPEKEEAHRYKIYSIAPQYLFGNELKLLEQMRVLAETKPEGWLQQGRALYMAFANYVRESKGEFKIDSKYAVVNNVSASMMSDIMGIEYGLKTPCKEMFQLNYDIAGTFKIYWKFMGKTYEEAERKLHNLRTFVMDRLVTNGVEMKIGDNKVEYNMLASNPSQQKKGQCYMGEHKTMIRTEKLREFGWTMDDAIERRTDNAAEWLKRNATLMTPSKPVKVKCIVDGKPEFRTIDITEILMVDDVEIERMFNNVTMINGRNLSSAESKKLKLTMFDGQAIWLIDGAPTTQMRGCAIKDMAVAKPDYKLPEFATDIMGNKVRVADYAILMTKSCWKAAKMGMNWYQFRDMVKEMAKECEGYDLLRAVRYSDREIGDEENPRNLARQATQQIIKLMNGEADRLTRKTRQWLKNHKKYWRILAEMGELDKPEEKRSPLARLINRMPQIIVHPYFQQYLKAAWDAKKNKACSGRLRTKGVYPYICQDPIAQIQICLEGCDPYNTNLGVVPEGYVNLPKVTEGRKVYTIRYPANYIVGMILRQKNIPEFAKLGNIAVLSYYGDTITRADGDFDGDEMLFLFDNLMISMMERIIEQFKPTLIDFPHGKVPCDQPFGTKEKFCHDVAEALVRAQEFNLVGRYSNLAVICLQQASIAKDPKVCAKWLNAAKVAHVGAIVCLDMVKGAEVPEELKQLLKDLNTKVRAEHKMPWNQIFSHPELTEEDVDPRSNSTQDVIAGTIYDDVGDFSVDFEDKTPVEWSNDILYKFVPENIARTTVRTFVVSEDDLARIRGCHFEDADDSSTWAKMDNGEAIGMKEWLMLGWHNSASMLWKMSGADMAEKRTELYRYIRRVLIKSIVENKAVSADGHEWTLKEKYVSMVKSVIESMFDIRVNGAIQTEYVDKSGNTKKYGNGIQEEKKGSWMMFLARVFAQDICAMTQDLTDEFVSSMCYVSSDDEEDSCITGFFDEADCADVVCDTVWIGGDYDDEENDVDFDFDVFDEAC